MTKGALYHHFSGKQALFEAVFEQVETDASKTINKALKGKRDPWEKAQAGLRAFLGVVQEPRYRRIVIQEGPAVLGYERYREQEERSTFATVLDIVRSVLGAGSWELDEAMLQTFARIFFGAMSSAGESVATAEDPDEAADRVESAIGFIIAGFRSLADAGVGLPDTLVADDDQCRTPLLPDGDAAAVLRHQLDPGVPRRARSGHRPWSTASSAASSDSLVQVRAHQPAVVEDQRLALARELRLRHRVAGRVAVAGVADLDPQHQHGVGRELVTGAGVGVLVDVGAASGTSSSWCARPRS